MGVINTPCESAMLFWVSRSSDLVADLSQGRRVLMNASQDRAQRLSGKPLPPKPVGHCRASLHVGPGEQGA